MIIFIIAIVVGFWLFRPRIGHKEVQVCDKHQWVDFTINEQRDGLICKKCFRRPG